MSELLVFGDFQFDSQSGQLWRAGVPVKLAPQPARILGLLAARPGQLVTREEIRRQVWGDETFVDFEHSLNFAIKQIRTALADDAEAPRFIQTFPKRGYAFIATLSRPRPTVLPVIGAVSILLVAAAFALWWSVAHVRNGPPGRVVIAVLPLRNVDADQRYISDGLTEDLITALGRLDASHLAVIGRTSAMQYRNTNKPVARIARELHADYLLEGSVRRAGDRIRINAQLTRAADDSHVWAETYDRDFGDVLAVESEVSRAIAEQIRLKLQPRAAYAPRPRPDPQTYEMYLKGRYHLRQLDAAGVNKAIPELQAALRRDPAYAPAHAALADCYYALSNMHIDPAEAMAKARASASRALELDPHLAEGHLSLALVKAFYDWDWMGADRGFRAAIDADPSLAEARGWYGAYLALMGDLQASEAQLRRAHELDPLSLPVNWTIALPAYLAGNYDEAIARGKAAQELFPDSFLPFLGLGSSYEEKGDLDTAIALYEKARTLDDTPEILAFLARAYALRGERDRARSILKDLTTTKRYVSPYELALVYEALGDDANAFAQLEIAFETHAEGMIGIALDPRLRRLRSDPRFTNLVSRMRLPPAPLRSSEISSRRSTLPE